MTADIYGVPFKIKIDSYIPDVLICDFKTSSNIRKSWYIPELGHTDFIQYWGYTVQLAIYQKVVEINTGKKLPCYIAVVTKEDDPDIEVIYVSQNTLDETMELIREKIPEVQKIKDGEIKPVRCENCAYCRRTKKLIKPISQVDLIQNI